MKTILNIATFYPVSDAAETHKLPYQMTEVELLEAEHEYALAVQRGHQPRQSPPPQYESNPSPDDHVFRNTNRSGTYQHVHPTWTTK